MKKVISLVLALVMIMALGVTAFAQTVGTASDTTGTLTINNVQPGQLYDVYRVFEAIPGASGKVSYKVISGKTLPENDYFVDDGLGNISATDAAKNSEGGLSENAIKWIADNIATVGVKVYDDLTPAVNNEVADTSITIQGLAYGYYYVTTTTGSLVSVDTTNKTVSVDDKNPPTEITKKITAADGGDLDDAGKNAIAQVGKVVDYESRINIKVGAYNYSFTDVMSDGLTLNVDSVKVYVVDKGAAVAADATAVNATCGTVAAENKTSAEADISIAFGDAWLKDNVGKDIVIQYSATVNSSALIADASNPNTATIKYGNEDNPLTDSDDADVWSARIKVEKVDGDGAALAGAGFVLKKANQYYKNTDGVVSWVDSIDDATEYFSNGNGGATIGNDGTATATTATDYDVVFTGLQDGTYTLVEKTVPSGYNKSADQTFTINGDDYSLDNLQKTAIVVNKAGSAMPITGGMGTTIFYVLGTVMVLGAAVLLITKRRMITE